MIGCEKLVALEANPGELSLLAMGRGPLSLVALSRDDLPSVLAVILDEQELAVLAELVAEAEKLGASLSPGQGQMLGYFRPRPLGLRVVAVRPRAAGPELRLSFFQRDISFDALLPAGQVGGWQEALARRARSAHEARKSAPLLTGTWQESTGLIRVDTEGQLRELHLMAGMSHIWGPFQEFLQPPEVPAGTRVRLDVAELEGRCLLARACVLDVGGVLPDGPAPDPEFARYSRQGEATDELLLAGRLHAAREGRVQLLNAMRSTGKLDGFLLAKIALAEMHTMLLAGDVSGAGQLWTGSDKPQDLLETGIKLVETGQTSLQDLMLYRQMEAYLHSLNSDSTRALPAVNGVMSTVFRYFQEFPNRWQQALTLRNWRMHLAEVFDGQPVPAAALGPWEEAQRAFGGTVLPKLVCLPLIANWKLDADQSNAPQHQLGRPAPDSRPWWKRLLGLR